MGFKDLFIVSDETPNEKPKETAKQSASTTKFPNVAPEAPVVSNFNFPTQESVKTTFTPTPVPAPQSFPNVASSEYLDKAIEVYQKGFDNLNQPGFDFYEFYQSVKSGGIDNPQVYSMAFQMASTMDKSITKPNLIHQADYYLGEIQKSYEEFAAKGEAKRQETEALKVNENQSLINELSDMNHQLEALKTQIEDRTRKLSAIDSKYLPQLSDIASKLAANITAKDRIMNSIQTVKQGINNNVK